MNWQPEVPDIHNDPQCQAWIREMHDLKAQRFRIEDHYSARYVELTNSIYALSQRIRGRQQDLVRQRTAHKK